MAVPAWVTAGISTLQGLGNAAPQPDSPEKAAYATIRAYMLANSGTWPSDATTTIRNAILAQEAARVEQYIRSTLLAELLRIQAAG